LLNLAVHGMHDSISVVHAGCDVLHCSAPANSSMHCLHLLFTSSASLRAILQCTVTTRLPLRCLLQGLAARVKAARSVLVVGGGPLGVELAGEVLTVRTGGGLQRSIKTTSGILQPGSSH
jgi:hypothetical protein